MEQLHVFENFISVIPELAEWMENQKLTFLELYEDSRIPAPTPFKIS